MVLPSRILIRGVNWLGDAVMTTPALLRLRQRFPEAHIALLSPQGLGELWLHHPALDRVISFPKGTGPLKVAGQLRGEGYDTALVFPNSPRSGIEVWLARIPRRVGYARRWRNWFLSEVIPSRPNSSPMRKRSVGEIQHLIKAHLKPPAPRPGARAHQIHEYLHLAAALGASPDPLPPVLAASSEELEQARMKWLAAARPGLLLGLNPSAAYGRAKCWPAENFAAVMRHVSTRVQGTLWFVFGAAVDQELCAEVARRSGAPVLNLAGQTSLRELMALLKLCRVLLTNDSGPMHVAAALGTPVIVPFGSTSPELTGPGLPGSPGHFLLNSGAPCAPCFRRDCPIDFRCMRDVTVDQAASAVFRALESRGPDQG